MPTFAVLLSLFADLTSPSAHVTRVRGYPLPFAVRDDEPHYLVEKEGWIVYIGWPLDGDGPTFRMGRSRDGGAHWKVTEFQYDWYPREVRLAGGRLDIHFEEEDCMGTSPVRMEGPVGGRVWETKRD